ncbi:MAG TPA: amidohydrolase family protein [Mycobacteriales bacterium]|nr:amidohydrolase family protein [Mycobacteriales bacterium]
MNRDHPIIDVHAHWGPWFFAMDIGSAAENIRLMDEYGITIQLVSASEGVVYDAPGGNANLAPVLEANPRLRGYLVVNPNNPEAGEADLRRHLGSGLWSGVKIHTGYPLRTIDSPQMAETFAMLDSFGVTLLIHTWGPDVLVLPKLLETNRNMRVVAGHMGADRWDLAAEAARSCDRLYLEPSCSLTESMRMRHVLDHTPPGQILFGTDATLIDPAVAFGLLEDADPAPELAERIYWKNAADLFGLHDQLESLAGGRK